MRIFEIASAEEQLALWKLISDNTWRAVSQQAAAERRQRADKAAQSKLKPKRGGKRGGRKSLPPPPPIKPPPPQAKPLTPTLKPQKNSGGAAPQAIGLINPQARSSPAPTGFSTAPKATTTESVAYS
jgi:hypothetical protein